MKHKTKSVVEVGKERHRLYVSDEPVLCSECSLYGICRPTVFDVDEVICVDYIKKFDEKKFYFFELETK